MQFALNEDQIAVREMAREFAAEKIAPHAIRWDEEKHFPVDVMREAARLGMGGIYIRDDVGGSRGQKVELDQPAPVLSKGCGRLSGGERRQGNLSCRLRLARKPGHSRR